jgi:hypothetical protein|tara:strand:+ start:877 stop:1590 length:714 start_codon:yes stop_codon:yes gene_type:complete
MAVHFTGPVLYAGVNGSKKWFADLPVGVNPDYVVLMDDFTGIALDATSDWTVVKDSGASAAIGADAESGTLILSSAATTDNDGASVQGNEIFRVASGRDIWFETKCWITDAEEDNMDLCVGLTINFATNPEAMLTATDRIVFQINDGGTSILAITEKNGTETSTDTGLDAEAFSQTLGFHVKGTGSVEFFVNRVKVATHTTNIPDDENLAVAAMQLSGSASGTKSANIDYLLASQTR